MAVENRWLRLKREHSENILLGMYTRRLDAALDAIAACRRRLPDLGDLYEQGSPQREAIDRAVAAVEEARVAVFGRLPERRP